MTEEKKAPDPNTSQQKEQKEVSDSDASDSKFTQWRTIILKTDGNNIHIARAEVSGRLELLAILELLLKDLKEGNIKYGYKN